MTAAALLGMLSCRPAREEALMDRLQTLSSMAELGTVEYKVKKIIKADDAVWYKYGDRKILFSCPAYLKAGIDMREFSESDVTVDNAGGITVTLPKAKLLTFNMPADEIRQELSIVNGLRFDFTPEEKQQLLAQGQQAIADEVAGMGILDDAEANARHLFTALLAQLGYENITINFR